MLLNPPPNLNTLLERVLAIPPDIASSILASVNGDLLKLADVTDADLAAAGMLMPLSLGDHIRALGQLLRHAIMPLATVEITEPDQIAALLYHAIANLPQEVFVVACLDSANRMVPGQVAVAHIGTVDQVDVAPREIARIALRYNAAAIILAHNHPSGAATATEDDIEATRQIIALCKQLNIQVLDHLIFGRNEYTSLAATGSLN